MKYTAAAATTIAISALSASAQYTITATSGGAASVTVGTGRTFDVEVSIDSGGAHAHNSAIYRVVMSQPGLGYTGYAWEAPYATGGIFDDSAPLIDALDPRTPLVLDALTLAGGPAYPPDVVDVELSNVVESGTFDDGLLTTLTLRVPPGFAVGQPLMIWVEPDTIADGFEIVPAVAGPPLEVMVTLTGDFDGDLDVDVDDLIEVILSWGACSAGCSGDADGDGQVDIDDLLLVILNWTR